jgi:hypothetical protein
MSLMTLQLDAEYYDSNEKYLTPVCACIRINDKSLVYWFPQDKAIFIEHWRKCMVRGVAIISYFASAEARFLLAMGFTEAELLSWKWLDPYVIWRMLTYSHPDYKYGDHYKDGKWFKSIPPPSGYKEETWDENDEGDLKPPPKEEFKYKRLESGLSAVLAARLHVVPDVDHKTAMRNLILTKKTFTEKEKAAIKAYCQEDVIHLKALFINLYKEVHKVTSGNCDIAQIMQLSRYSVCCGIMENNGIPFNVAKAENLGHNYYKVDDELIMACNEAYPMYVLRTSTKAEKAKGHRGVRWIESYDCWKDYIKNQKYEEMWPKSEKTNKFRKDKDTLEKFSGDATINLFRQTKKSRNHIKYFRPEGMMLIRKNIGSDGRIRVLLSPFGSKTGRNQPSVKQGYIYGMSTWIRPLVSDINGIILGGDFSAQEIALQGWISGDEKFLEAYRSGDPYTWFAQVTNSMQDDVYREHGKFYFKETKDLVPPEVQQICKTTRSAYKALLLGVGFGMGLDKLSVSITSARVLALPDNVKNVLNQAMIRGDQEKIEEIMTSVRVVSGNTDFQKSQYPASAWASTYRNHHYKTFSQYWKWRKAAIEQYYQQGYLKLNDGWCLLIGEDRDNTVANFPVQGTAACILRKAVENCIFAGLKVFSPLHDCIYISSTAEKEVKDRNTLTQCLKEAVKTICGDDIIRIDLDKYETDWVNFTSTYTKDKQADAFKLLGKYMVQNTQVAK